MGGPFSFLIGLGSLLTSGCMALKEENDLDAKNREYNSQLHSPGVQWDYEEKVKWMDSYYDFDKIKKAILKDYPGLSNTQVYMITKSALAKRMMESETIWKYWPPAQIRDMNIDLDRYSLDEFRKRREE